MLRAGQRLLHHLGTLHAYDVPDLVDQAGFYVVAVQPPAKHGHQQDQQRSQAEDAVKRHGRAHAQAVRIQPQADRPDHGAKQFFQEWRGVSMHKMADHAPMLGRNRCAAISAIRRKP